MKCRLKPEKEAQMAISDKTYHDQLEVRNTLKIREMISGLPRSVAVFMRGVEPVTQSRTRLAYATDLKNFFEYLENNNPEVKAVGLRNLSEEMLSRITAFDIEEYLEYLKVYVDANGRTVTNNEQAIKRKLCALRSYYKYMYQHKMVTVNPAVMVSVPKMHEKAIVRLDPNETARLLDHVETGDGYSKRKTAARTKNSVRNLAIITLLLGTGIRVSECVGLDLKDLDFDNDRIKVVRKGGSESFVYFGEEVRKALKDSLRASASLLTLPRDMKMRSFSPHVSPGCPYGILKLWLRITPEIPYI